MFKIGSVESFGLCKYFLTAISDIVVDGKLDVAGCEIDGVQFRVSISKREVQVGIWIKNAFEFLSHGKDEFVSKLTNACSAKLGIAPALSAFRPHWHHPDFDESRVVGSLAKLKRARAQLLEYDNATLYK